RPRSRNISGNQSASIASTAHVARPCDNTPIHGSQCSLPSFTRTLTYSSVERRIWISSRKGTTTIPTASSSRRNSSRSCASLPFATIDSLGQADVEENLIRPQRLQRVRPRRAPARRRARRDGDERHEQGARRE